MHLNVQMHGVQPQASVSQLRQAAAVEAPADVERTAAPQRAQLHGVNAEYLQNLRGPEEVPRRTFGEKLSGLVRSGIRAFKAVLDKIAHVPQGLRAERELSRTMEEFKGKSFTFTHPQTGKNFSWMGTHFVKMVNSLPKSQRMEAMNTIQSHIQGRIETGAQLYAMLSGNGPLPEASLENIANFTLYLYATAAAQGDDFVRGSFNVKDPQGRIASWLDSSTAVYARSSSHLSELQGKQITELSGKTHLNVPRGLDIPMSYHAGLPVKMQTITFGTITPLEGTNGERRVFVKAETYGCRLNTLSSKLVEKSASGIDTRSFCQRDIHQAIGHGASFIKTELLKVFGVAVPGRRESFPEGLKDFIKGWREKGLKGASPEMQNLFRQIVDCKCEKKGLGLRQLNLTLNSVERQLQSLPKETPVDKELIKFITELKVQIAELPHHDRLDVRIGNEVLID